jgi:hypothetical protein
MGLFRDNNRGFDEIRKRKLTPEELAKLAEEAEMRGEKPPDHHKKGEAWMEFDESEFANVSKHPINHILYRQRPKDDRTFFLRRKKRLMKDRKYIPKKRVGKRGKVTSRRKMSTGDFIVPKFRAIPPAFHWFQETTGGTSCPACGKLFKTMGEVHRHHVRFHHTLSRRVDNFSLAAPPKRNWPQFLKHIFCDCPCIPCKRYFEEIYLLEPKELFFTKRSIDFAECPKCVCDEVPAVCMYYTFDFDECPKVWEATKKSIHLTTKLVLITALWPIYITALTFWMFISTAQESVHESRLEYGNCWCEGEPCKTKHGCCGLPTGCGCYGIWRFKVRTACHDACFGRKKRVFVTQEEDNPELTNYPKHLLYIEPEPEPAPLTAKEKRKLAREKARRAHGVGEMVVEDMDTIMSSEITHRHAHVPVAPTPAVGEDPVALVIER